MLGATGLTLHVGPPHADLTDAQQEMQAAHGAAHEDAFLTAYLNGALVASRGDVLDVARNHQSEVELAAQTLSFEFSSAGMPAPFPYRP